MLKFLKVVAPSEAQPKPSPSAEWDALPTTWTATPNTLSAAPPTDQPSIEDPEIALLDLLEYIMHMNILLLYCYICY